MGRGKVVDHVLRRFKFLIGSNPSLNLRSIESKIYYLLAGALPLYSLFGNLLKFLHYHSFEVLQPRSNFTSSSMTEV